MKNLNKISGAIKKFCIENELGEEKKSELLHIVINNLDDLIPKTTEIEDIVAAVDYGFKYATESQNDGFVPDGNTFQWYRSRKGYVHIPKDWVKKK